MPGLGLGLMEVATCHAASRSAGCAARLVSRSVSAALATAPRRSALAGHCRHAPAAPRREPGAVDPTPHHQGYCCPCAACLLPAHAAAWPHPHLPAAATPLAFPAARLPLWAGPHGPCALPALQPPLCTCVARHLWWAKSSCNLRMWSENTYY